MFVASACNENSADRALRSRDRRWFTLRIKRSVAIVTALGLAMMAVSCSSDQRATSAPDSTPETAPLSTGVSLPSGARYVALGSSFAAGTGVPQQASTCGPSDQNYPSLVAAQLELTLIDVSCSAATTANIIDTPQGDAPAQISAVTPDTELVTITVGGNDVGYSATALQCGDPSTVCSVDQPKLETDLTKMTASLETLIDGVRAKAPSSTVVLVTYPRVVPDQVCPALSFTDDEAALIRDMGEKLESAFIEVAARTGVILVDPYHAQGDHTVCAPAVADRWTDGKVATVGFPYHPTATGHKAMASLVVDAMHG